jgi:transposase
LVERGTVVIVVGIDPHKNTHTAVAVDAAARELAQFTVRARAGGFQRLLVWARALGDELLFAVEDGRHVSSGLERFLLGRGEEIVRVPPKLMAEARRNARRRGKSDPIDARAVALAALREPDLPRASLPGIEREIRLLVDHREDLLAQRTAIQNRLRWHLHDLDSSFAVPPRALDRLVWLRRVEERLRRFTGSVEAEIALEQVQDCATLTGRINALERRIATVIAPLAPGLIALQGCGALTAAKVVGEVGGVRRFASDAKFAMHIGAAPLDASSGRNEHHRLNRSGNRQLNCAIHRIAVTQKRIHEPAKIYLKNKTAAGKTDREALRSLKRHIARKVFMTLEQDELRRISASGLT